MIGRIVAVSRSPEDTRMIAASLAGELRPGDVVALCGDLGAGKTNFVQGAAAALGVTDRVTSPTFVLVREYQGKLPILHIDVYRMGNLQELVDLGYEEFLDPRWVVFIEWGDAVGSLLPEEYVRVEINATGDQERQIAIEGNGPTWMRRLAAVHEACSPYLRQEPA